MSSQGSSFRNITSSDFFHTADTPIELGLNNSTLSLNNMDSSIQPSPYSSPLLSSSSGNIVSNGPPPLPTYPSQKLINKIKKHIPEFKSLTTSSYILSGTQLHKNTSFSYNGLSLSSLDASSNDSVPSDIDLNLPSPTIPFSFSMSGGTLDNDHSTLTSGLMFHEGLNYNAHDNTSDERQPVKYVNRNPFARFATEISNQNLQPFSPPTPTLNQRQFQIESRHVPLPGRGPSVSRSRSLNHFSSMPTLIGAQLQRRSHIRRSNAPSSLRNYTQTTRQPLSEFADQGPISSSHLLNTSCRYPQQANRVENYTSNTGRSCSDENQQNVEQEFQVDSGVGSAFTAPSLPNCLSFPNQSVSEYHSLQLNLYSQNHTTLTLSDNIPVEQSNSSDAERTINSLRQYSSGQLVSSSCSPSEFNSDDESIITVISSSDCSSIARNRQSHQVTPPLSLSSRVITSMTSFHENNIQHSTSTDVSSDNDIIRNIEETNEFDDNSNVIIIQQQLDYNSPTSLLTPPSTPIISAGYPSIDRSDTFSNAEIRILENGDWGSVYMMEIQSLDARTLESNTDIDLDMATDSESDSDTDSISTASTGLIEYFEDEPPDYNDLFSEIEEPLFEDVYSNETTQSQENFIILTQDQLEQEIQDFLEQLPPTPEYTKKPKQGELSIPNSKVIEMPVVNEYCNQPRCLPPDYVAMPPELEPYIMRPAFSQDGGDTRTGRNTVYFRRPPSMIIEE